MESRLFRRERRLWLAATAWVLLIYSTLYSVRAPIEFLRERNLLRVTVAAVFLLTAATVATFLLKSRPRRRALLVLVGAGIVYLALFLRMERAEEKLHFLEYGFLAAMIHEAWVTRQRRIGGRQGKVRAWIPPLLAVLATSALGWGDEGIQALLPNRVYDIRDVGLNVSAAVLAVLGIIAWRWANRSGS